MEHLEETDQDNSANQGNDEAAKVEAIDRTADTEKTEYPAAEDGTYDTNDNIQKDTLLTVGAHKHRCDPTDQTSEDDIDEKTHKSIVSGLLILTIELDGGLRGGDGLAHHQHLDDAPGDDIVDEHSEDGRPFEDTTLYLRRFEDSDEWCSKWSRDRVDEAGETGSGVGAEEFQDETKGEENLDEAEDIPDDLCPTIEWLCAAR